MEVAFAEIKTSDFGVFYYFVLFYYNILFVVGFVKKDFFSLKLSVIETI